MRQQTYDEPRSYACTCKEVAEARKVYNARNDELLQIRQELHQLVNKVMDKMETAIQISLEGSKLG